MKMAVEEAPNTQLTESARELVDLVPTQPTTVASEKPPRVQSVARATAILLEIAASPAGLNPKEISERVGLSRQTTYHLLHTLIGARFVKKGPERRYVLGLAIGALTDGFSRQLAPPEYLMPYVRHLANVTGEAAYAAGWEAGEIVVICVARGANVVQAANVGVGRTEDGHARASGKLLLALAPEAARREYLQQHQLRRRTPKTICNVAELEKEFAAIRALGYAIDREEYFEGLSCLAVPLIVGPYVLGLSAPSARFAEKRDEYLAHALREAAT
jgi:IclR family transcriptional regulator, acetate operon repressor